MCGATTGGLSLDGIDTKKEAIVQGQVTRGGEPVSGAYVRLHEHLAVPWRRVAQSGSGMAALVVLLALIAIGLVDSLHFRPAMQGGDAQGKTVYAVEVRSVLGIGDAALADLVVRISGGGQILWVFEDLTSLSSLTIMDADTGSLITLI